MQIKVYLTSLVDIQLDIRHFLKLYFFQVTTMELPNPRRKSQVFATTLWYPELTQAAREKGGGTGATWRPWPPSITTPRQRLRTRMRTTETYQQMVSSSDNFSLLRLRSRVAAKIWVIKGRASWRIFFWVGIAKIRNY